MSRTTRALYYGDYLKLDQLLGAQQPESARTGDAAHDEMLFIIVHQAYELWFKQILHELRSIVAMFSDEIVDDRQMGRIVARLERIHIIQRLLIGQIEVIESMTPLDFLEFRDLLIPASGFQSVQFREIEALLGMKSDMRLPADQEFVYSRLSEADRRRLDQADRQTSLLDATQAWLERLPFLSFGDFDFWREYARAVERMLRRDRAFVENNPTLPESVRQVQLAEMNNMQARFDSILDEQQFEALRSSGEIRFSHDAMLAALFINLYRDEPLLQLPFRYLTSLVEVDELFATWRARHAIMVHRMLGAKIGTGGTSGHDYLSRSATRSRIFVDLFNLSTFLIPRSELPVLPESIVDSMRFRYS
jgi:tryptophan 2,3-dioxygenase